MINPNHILHCVIRPVLAAMGEKYSSPAAERLILGVIAQESNAGHFLTQLDGGPARGICQIEPWVAKDYAAYLRTDHPAWAVVIKHASGVDITRLSDDELELQLICNMALCVAFTRMYFWRFDEPLPDAGDVEGLAAYWKKYWNTEEGRGEESEFVDNLMNVEMEING